VGWALETVEPDVGLTVVGALIVVLGPVGESLPPLHPNTETSPNEMMKRNPR
jgi:hypothetical protein